MSFHLALQEHQAYLMHLPTLQPAIEAAGQCLLQTFRQGHKLLLCGNGGSAADCQHIAAEFVVRYRKVRAALPAIALTTDTSILTAHPNDFSFDTVFERQVAALGQTGDCLLAISTSGNSPNIIAAVQQARRQHLHTIVLSGHEGGRLAGMAEHDIIIPGSVTARIQEMHILIAHWWCEQVEQGL